MQRLLTDYGMILVLIALCLLFSVLTLKQQVPEGKAAVAELAGEVRSRAAKTDVILAVGAARQDTAKLAEETWAGVAGQRLLPRSRGGRNAARSAAGAGRHHTTGTELCRDRDRRQSGRLARDRTDTGQVPRPRPTSN